MKKSLMVMGLLSLLVGCNYSSSQDNLYIDNKDYPFIYSILSKGITIHEIKDTAKKTLEILEIPSHINNVPVVKISSCAFEETMIKEVKFLGDSEVSIIENYAFVNCLHLEKITLPSSITYLGEGVFDSCSKLEEVDLTNLINLNHLASSTFFANSSLVEVTLPINLKSIGNEAFMNCTKLEKVYIPSEINEIGYYSFCNDIALEVVFSGIKEIPDTFSNGWNESETLCNNGTYYVSYTFFN